MSGYRRNLMAVGLLATVVLGGWCTRSALRLMSEKREAYQLVEVQRSFFYPRVGRNPKTPYVQSVGGATLLTGPNGTRFVYRPVTPDGRAVVHDVAGEEYIAWSQEPAYGDCRVFMMNSLAVFCEEDRDVSWLYQVPRRLLDSRQEAAEQEFRSQCDRPWALDAPRRLRSTEQDSPENVRQ